MRLKKYGTKIAVTLLAGALLLVGCGGGESSSEPEVLTEEQIRQQKIEANRNIREGEFTLVQFLEPEVGQEIAVIETTAGTIRVMLFEDQAPQAVKQFKALVASGGYEGKKFGRMVQNYLLETEQPAGAASAWENEYSLDLWHFRGALGMDSAAKGQFYIIQNNSLTQDMLKQMEEAGFPSPVFDKYKRLGGAPWLDGNSTVFGQVISDMNMVDIMMESAPAASSEASTQAAQEPVITKITIETYAASGQGQGSSSASAAG